jgi:hypothetical protein
VWFWIWLHLCIQASIWVASSAAPRDSKSRVVRAADDRRIAGRYIIRLDPDADKTHLYALLQKVLHDNDDESRPELTANVR